MFRNIIIQMFCLTSLKLLLRFLQCHSDVKTYLCTICGKSYKSPHNLKIHTRVHTGLYTIIKHLRLNRIRFCRVFLNVVARLAVKSVWIYVQIQFIWMLFKFMGMNLMIYRRFTIIFEELARGTFYFQVTGPTSAPHVIKASESKVPSSNTLAFTQVGSENKLLKRVSSQAKKLCWM